MLYMSIADEIISVQQQLSLLQGAELLSAYQKLHQLYAHQDLHRALDIIDQIVPLCEDLGDIRSALYNENFRFLYLSNLGHQQQARDGYLGLLQSAQEYGDDVLLSAIHNNMGMTWHEEDMEKAFDWYLKALSFSRKANKQQFMAIQLRNLAELHKSMGSISSETFSYYKEAIELFEHLEAKLEISFCYSTMAGAYMDIGDFNQASQCIKQGRRFAGDSEFHQMIAREYEMQLRFLEQAFPACLALTQDLIPFFERHGESRSLMFARHYSGICHFRLGKTTKAQQELLTAKHLANDTHPLYNITINQGLIDLAVAKDDYKRAFELMQENSLLEKQKIDEEKLKVISKLQTEFDTVRKDKENVELKLKALRAQMNPHFIFNSLNAIQSFVSENRNLDAIHFIASFSKLMRQTLSSSERGMIRLDKEIEFLRRYLDLEKMRFEEAFDFEIKFPADLETEFISLPPMLLQPFVENAIVHGVNGLDRKGMIKLQFNESDDGHQLICQIEDNGRGRKAAQASRKKDTTHKSMGIQITRDRLDALNPGQDTKVVYEDLVDAEGQPCGTRVSLCIGLS